MKRHLLSTIIAGSALAVTTAVGSAGPAVTQPVNFSIAVPTVLRVDGSEVPGARNDDNPGVFYGAAWYLPRGAGHSVQVGHYVECNAPIHLTLTAEPTSQVPGADVGGQGARPAREERNLNGTPQGRYDYLDADYGLALDLSPTGESDDSGLGLVDGRVPGAAFGTARTVVIQDHDGEFWFYLRGWFDTVREADAGNYHARMLLTITALDV